MKKLKLQIELLSENQPIPYNLLKLADPSVIQIDSYLKSGTCYIAKIQSEIVGVIILNSIDTTKTEIKNIAIKESEQGKGLGKKLLRYVEQVCRETGYKSLLIGTGNSSIGQLALYQKEGFELDKIKKDFFLNNYSNPIYENGIQCKHMLLLKKNLT
ncbi:GNAT family N-acetyltransferase [Tenacibaculum sp.]|nr:GNAT family N-acetyltransferase [Tenacibaculum sp.]